MEPSIKGSEVLRNPQPAGIGGWLILPAIVLVLGPISWASLLVLNFASFREVAATGFGGIFALHLLVQMILFVFLVYASIRFFGRKSDTPYVITAFMITSLAASATLIVIEFGAGFGEVAGEDLRRLGRQVIAAAICIPYFRVSNRVKTTFVK